MKPCKWYAEYEGICCQGDCPECADICPYENKQAECEFYESEDADKFERSVSLVDGHIEANDTTNTKRVLLELKSASE